MSVRLFAAALLLPLAALAQPRGIVLVDSGPASEEVEPRHRLRVISRPGSRFPEVPADNPGGAESAAVDKETREPATVQADRQSEGESDTAPMAARQARQPAESSENGAADNAPKSRRSESVAAGSEAQARQASQSGEASRTREVEVAISGIEGDLEKNARVYLTLTRKDSVVRSRYQLRRLVSKGRDEIVSALEAFGYYNAEVASDIDPDPPEGQPVGAWRVRYQVTLGEPVVYAGFKVQIAGPGAKSEAVQQAAKDLKIKTGDVLLHPDYEAEKRRILAAARDAAYIDAKYAVSELRVNPTTNKVNALLRLATGPLFEFGEVTFDQDVLEDELVQEFVPLKAGERFDSNKLINTQLALNDTRYFARVEVDVDRDNAVPAPDAESYTALDGSQKPETMRLPVNILLTPGKHRSYKAGFGFGTDTGTRVSLGYENRRVNKKGHQLNAETRVSEFGTQAAVRYTLPVVNKGTDRLSFDNSYKNEKPADEGELVQQRSEIRLERVKPRLRRSVYLAFEREEFELGNQRDNSKLLIPGVGVSWVNTTNRLRPKFGLSLSGDIHGAAEGVLADTTFVQFSASADSVFSFAPRWRAIGRADLVYSVLGDDFNSLPASQRQFAGGTGSVRGFGFQSLGSRDDSGEVIGGRHLSTFTTELEYQFANSWAVAAFVDSGNAGQTFLDDLQVGAGLGLRWILPFGQVRLDIAQPVTGDEDQVRFHLSLGPDL